MTRAAMIKYCKDTLGEEVGSVAADSPFSWDNLMRDALDRLVRGTDAAYLKYAMDITPGVSSYSCNPLYKVRRVGLYHPTGLKYNLTITKKDWMDQYVTDWEYSNDASGFPRYAVYSGANLLQIYPVPNFTSLAYNGTTVLVPGGLEVEGYGVFSTGVWDNPTDECPIPESYHLTVCYGAMLLRCAKHPIDPAQMKVISDLYKEGRGQLEKHVAVQTQANAVRYDQGSNVKVARFSPFDE